MGNHPREAWSTQANSQIGGTIGEPKRKSFDLAGASAHDDTACVRILTESGIMLWRQPVLTRTYRPWMRVSGRAISEGLARDDTHKPMAP